ncbi:hypothetical protein BCR43DRAFT_490922, partial [Syncephalastrum racemosum]
MQHALHYGCRSWCRLTKAWLLSVLLITMPKLLYTYPLGSASKKASRRVVLWRKEKEMGGYNGVLATNHLKMEGFRTKITNSFLLPSIVGIVRVLFTAHTHPHFKGKKN